MTHHTQIIGLVLAGGQSRRMNSQPKWNLPLGSKRLIEHVIQRFEPQVDKLIINSSADDLAHYNYTLVPDVIEGYLGPLVGVLTGLEYAQQQGYQWLATCPCDSPFFPDDYVKQLTDAIENEGALGAVAKGAGRMQGVFGLWSTDLAQPLRSAILNKDMRAMGQWVKSAGHTVVVEMLSDDYTFFNINTPEDWEIAQQHQQSLPII